MYKFGITERGDAARDLSWTDKMGSVGGAVLITKNIDDLSFQAAALKHASKAIVHATITTLGGTPMEPNVSPWQKTATALIDFADLFPRDQLVLRIDPIVPTKEVLDNIRDMLSACRDIIRRVRFSFIDNYPHIKARGVQLEWNSFHAPIALQNWVIDYFSAWGNDFEFESCGEGNPHIPAAWRIGCISTKDYDILNMHKPEIFGNSKQRKDCMCLSTKTELLTRRTPCPNACMYCYWK